MNGGSEQQGGSDGTGVPPPKQEDPPPAAAPAAAPVVGEHDPNQPAPPSSAPSTPNKPAPSPAPGPTNNLQQAAASPAVYHPNKPILVPSHPPPPPPAVPHNSPAATGNKQQGLLQAPGGSPLAMQQYPPPPPHGYYTYGMMAYPPPPQQQQPATPSTTPNKTPPNSAGAASTPASVAPPPPPQPPVQQQQQQQKQNSPSRNTVATYVLPPNQQQQQVQPPPPQQQQHMQQPPHGYYPVQYAPHHAPMQMSPGPTYHPYAVQDWSKGRASGAQTGGEQQQQPQPPPQQQHYAPPPQQQQQHPVMPPQLYGWAPVPVAPHLLPGQYLPVPPGQMPPPNAIRYGGWGAPAAPGQPVAPPQQPQRAFNHHRPPLPGHPMLIHKQGVGGGASSPSRKKLLARSPTKTRTLKQSNQQGSGNRRSDRGDREVAQSPTQIATNHRDEIENMGCTCKKTRCLKLYCQCFGVKLHCGANCRCYHCANTPANEALRKDAMRNILSRNPLAFDTKFMDPRGNSTAAAASADNTTSEGGGGEAPRVLAHKLGCKCRKSACMKKYCECYAGNVKCTACCRCIGCKNMGNTPDFRDPDSNVGMSMGMPPVYHHHLPPPPPRTYSMAPQQQIGQAAPADHWGAAESLTFLKRGSPASDRKPAPHSGHRPFTLGVSPVTKASPMGKGGGSGVDMASMPSLASSSDGTSPGDRNKLASCSTPEDATKRQDDALLLAAVAMTEFGQSPPPTSSTHKRSLPSSERTAMTSNRFGGGNESEDEEDDIGTEPPSRRSIVFEESPSPPSSQRRSGRKRSKRFTGDDS